MTIKVNRLYAALTAHLRTVCAAFSAADIPLRTACAVPAAAVILLLTGCSASPAALRIGDTQLPPVPDEKRLIVCTSHKEEVYSPIIREFEERTGIWVEVKTGGTTELLEELSESGKSHEYDIMFGGGVESYEASKQYFVPYECRENDAVNDRYASPDHSWTPFTELPIVIIYNNKLVNSAQAPQGWNDLFDPRWQGSIAFADPGTSGSSCTILSTMIHALGGSEDQILERFSRALGGIQAQSSGEAVDQVSIGTRLLGITLEETAWKRIAEGADISIVYPKEGTSAVPDGCAIIKGAPHEENARLFVDFIVGKDVQQLAVDRLMRRTVRTDIPQDKMPEKIIDINLEQASSRQPELLNAWAALVQAEGGNLR